MSESDIFNFGLTIGEDPRAAAAASSLLDPWAIIKPIIEATPIGGDWVTPAKAELIRVATEKGDRN